MRVSKADRTLAIALAKKYGRAAATRLGLVEAAPARTAGAPALNRGLWAAIWANVQVRLDRRADQP